MSRAESGRFVIRPECGSYDGLRAHAAGDENDCAICVAFTAAELLEAERRRPIPILAIPLPTASDVVVAAAHPRHLRVVTTPAVLETRAC